MVSKTQRTTHAPGQFLGFSVQETRFLCLLLSASPGDSVSLEVFEDVGVKKNDGTLVVEQDKSFHSGNPVANRAPGLWKTIFNWLQAAENGEIDVSLTSFEIYLTSPKSGTFVEKFANAKSHEEARVALRDARVELWGEHPNYVLKQSVSQELSPYLEAVFKPQNKENLFEIISRFQLNCGSGSPLSDLHDMFIQRFCPEEIINEVLHYAQGWVKDTVGRLLEQKKPAIIHFNDFHQEMTSYIRKLDKRTILSSFARNPNTDEIEEELRCRAYVKQLDIIECGEDAKITAVRHFFKAAMNRTEWSVKGYVHSSSFDDFEDNLIHAWKNMRTRVNIQHANINEPQRGKLLYSECLLHTTRLEGIEVPHDFISGSFHSLADAYEIGWHPNYMQILMREPSSLQEIDIQPDNIASAENFIGSNVLDENSES
jgi:hypothetical protein